MVPLLKVSPPVRHHRGQFWRNLRTSIEASVIVSQPRDVCDSSTKPTQQPASSRQALHPLRGATPVAGRYTRSEEVQCPRIGCTSTPNKYLHGHTITSHTVRWAHCHYRQPTQNRLHPGKRYTRYGALHPLRGATPDQKRCNAHGSGAPPLPTNTFTATRSRHTPSDGHTATTGSRRRTGFIPACATPVTGHYTRYVTLHPLRHATPDQKRCNAHRSGAAPLRASTVAATRSRWAPGSTPDAFTLKHPPLRTRLSQASLATHCPLTSESRTRWSASGNISFIRRACATSPCFHSALNR